MLWAGGGVVDLGCGCSERFLWRGKEAERKPLISLMHTNFWVGLDLVELGTRRGESSWWNTVDGRGDLG